MKLRHFTQCLVFGCYIHSDISLQSLVASASTSLTPIVLSKLIKNTWKNAEDNFFYNPCKMLFLQALRFNPEIELLN